MALIRALVRGLLAAMLLATPVLAAPQASDPLPDTPRPSPREVSMVAGQTQVFRAESVKRVAVGQGNVAPMLLCSCRTYAPVASRVVALWLQWWWWW